MGRKRNKSNAERKKKQINRHLSHFPLLRLYSKQVKSFGVRYKHISMFYLRMSSHEFCAEEEEEADIDKREIIEGNT